MAKKKRLQMQRRQPQSSDIAATHQKAVEKTYWNGRPCKARVVRVIVGKALRPTWWCAGLEGTEREAVEIKYGGQTIYIDNDVWAADDDEGGFGWEKVTIGRGSPQWGHRGLPVERVLE